MGIAIPFLKREMINTYYSKERRIEKMYVSVQEATEITGVPERTLYRYIEKGVLRADPESKVTKVNIEDCYKIREEKRK